MNPLLIVLDHKLALMLDDGEGGTIPITRFIWKFIHSEGFFYGVGDCTSYDGAVARSDYPDVLGSADIRTLDWAQAVEAYNAPVDPENYHR